METTVIFVDDLTNDEGRELYTRLQLKTLSKSDDEKNGEVWTSFTGDKPQEEAEEEDIVKIFQSEQYPRSDSTKSQLFKVIDSGNGILGKYLNGDTIQEEITTDSKSFDQLYLTIDILHLRESRFIQLSTKIKVSDIKLVGLLQDMDVNLKIQWLIDLINRGSISFNEMYHCELRKSPIQDGELLFALKVKHDGIFKRAFELPLIENSNVDMNSHLLEDLHDLCSDKLQMKKSSIKLCKEKELLIKMILKFSELLSINELTKSIIKDNDQLTNILGVNLIDSKRKYPLSKLDIMMKQANEMFNVTVPGFYVPIMQSLQSDVKALKNSNEDSEKGAVRLDEYNEKKRMYGMDESGNDELEENDHTNTKKVKLENDDIPPQGACEDEDDYETPLSEEVDIEEVVNLSEETQLSDDDNVPL